MAIEAYHIFKHLLKKFVNEAKNLETILVATKKYLNVTFGASLPRRCISNCRIVIASG